MADFCNAMCKTSNGEDNAEKENTCKRVCRKLTIDSEIKKYMGSKIEKMPWMDIMALSKCGQTFFQTVVDARHERPLAMIDIDTVEPKVLECYNKVMKSLSTTANQNLTDCSHFPIITTTTTSDPIKITHSTPMSKPTTTIKTTTTPKPKPTITTTTTTPKPTTTTTTTTTATPVDATTKVLVVPTFDYDFGD